MKLYQLFENENNEETLHTVIQIVARLVSDAASIDGFRDELQTQYGSKLIQEIKQVAPEIIYNNQMFRTVSVEGLEPITLDEIKSHALAKGVQSWAKTREGMDDWLDQAYVTVEEDMADTVLSQTGDAIDVEAIVKLIRDRGLEQYANIMGELERAADVQEVIAPYYSNVKVIDTMVISMDDDDDY